MKKLLVGLCMMFLVSIACKASEIVVSGDLNIGNGIDGSFGAPIGDNGRFFSNILGGGTKVVVQEGYSVGSASDAYTSIANFYTGLGVTVDITTAPFTASDLAGARLLISAIPLSAYTPSEITLMSSFLSSGNTVFLIGENGGFAEGVAANGFVNSALSSLGAGMSLVDAVDDSGFHTATGSQIAVNPLTTGVNTFVYGAVSEVSGGTPLFFTTSGAPFVAVSSGMVVPEPCTVSLLFVGIAGLAALRRRLG